MWDYANLNQTINTLLTDQPYPQLTPMILGRVLPEPSLVTHPPESSWWQNPKRPPQKRFGLQSKNGEVRPTKKENDMVKSICIFKHKLTKQIYIIGLVYI